MFFNPTSANLEAEDLGYLEEHEIESGGFPYLQVLTHPNESIVKVKGARPWGIYLNSENAELINFTPDDNWKPVTFYTVEDEGFANAVFEIPAADRKAYESAGQEITEHTGFISQTLMFHLIYQSQTEVERKDFYQGKPSYRFVGLRWGSDEHKEAMAELLKERDADDNPTHRWCQRYMLILVGAEGKALHDGVVTYRAKGGAGGAFSMEMNELFKDLNDAYGKGKGNSRLKLFSNKNRHAGDMRSFCRLAMQFDLYKGGKDRAPFLVPVARTLPTGVPGDTKMREDKRGKDDDRTIKLYPSLLISTDGKTEMMVPQSSPLGARIREAIAEHESFPLPMQGREVEDAGTTGGDRVYTGTGILDVANLKYLTDGGVTVALLTEKGQVPLLIQDQDVADALLTASDEVTVTGIIPADGGPVHVDAWRVTAATVESATAPVVEQGELVATW